MIHRYQKKGLNFVLDVNSGAVHLLDDISYAVSGLLDENMGDTCPQSIIAALPDCLMITWLIPVRSSSLSPS